MCMLPAVLKRKIDRVVQARVADVDNCASCSVVSSCTCRLCPALAATLYLLLGASKPAVHAACVSVSQHCRNCGRTSERVFDGQACTVCHPLRERLKRSLKLLAWQRLVRWARLLRRAL